MKTVIVRLAYVLALCLSVIVNVVLWQRNDVLNREIFLLRKTVDAQAAAAEDQMLQAREAMRRAEQERMRAEQLLASKSSAGDGN